MTFDTDNPLLVGRHFVIAPPEAARDIEQQPDRIFRVNIRCPGDDAEI